MTKIYKFFFFFSLVALLTACGGSSDVNNQNNEIVAEEIDANVHAVETVETVETVEVADTNVPIWIIGDSTVSTYAKDDKRRGWGQMIIPMFQNPSRVDNRARSGASSKSFKTVPNYDTNRFWGNGSTHTSDGNKAGLKENILNTDTSKGGFLIIQFGHNDGYSKTYYPIKRTVPGLGNEFDIQLMEYINFAKKHNITPVLVTPMARMFHSSLTESYIHIEKKLSDNTPPPWEDMRGKKGDWPQTIKDIAKRENLILLDLTQKSKVHFTNDFNSDKAIRDKYSHDGEDFTHFNMIGAKKMADFIKELACDVEKVRNIGLCNQFKE